MLVTDELWSAICRSIGLSHLAPHSNWLNPEAYPAWPRDTVRQVDIVTGCFFLIRRRFWDALGGFDPAFFVYGEEVDLCLRARQFEAQPIIVPEATVIHHSGASQPHGPDKIIQILSARIRNVRLHFPRWQRRIAMDVTRAGALIRWVCVTLLAKLGISGQDRREMWRTVIRRRAEWWHGYPDWTGPTNAVGPPTVPIGADHQPADAVSIECRRAEAGI